MVPSTITTQTDDTNTAVVEIFVFVIIFFKRNSNGIVRGGSEGFGVISFRDSPGPVPGPRGK
jgi:hypothetical protein